MKNSTIKTKDIILAGLFTAIVFVCTYAIQITLPGIATGGLIHLGNVALFTIAVIFGKKYGAISGACGMALFDVLSPWVIWAPGTFIIRGIMGYAVGAIANGGKGEKKSMMRLVLALTLPSVWMIFGYFGYNFLLYRDLPAAIASIPGDITQAVAGVAIALPAILAFQKSGFSGYLRKLSTSQSIG